MAVRMTNNTPWTVTTNSDYDVDFIIHYNGQAYSNEKHYTMKEWPLVKWEGR